MVPPCPLLPSRLRSQSVFAFVIIILLTATSVRSQESSAPVLSAAERSDSFEEKMKLLQEAWERKDFELARSLTHSLRDTVIQTQHEEEPAGQSLIPAEDFRTGETLPEEWRQWSNGWKYFKTLTIEETAGEVRRMEPVEIRLSFPGDQVTSLRRELRLARISNQRLTEVPCQVFHEVTRRGLKYASILWMAEPEPLAKHTYLVFYGNPNAELPEYPSDLDTKGEGFALDISNAFYKASLSRQTGQLERITLRREHGLELFSGGEGHGEPPGIDWAHDYVDTGSFQKLRISLWETCPDFEIIRGPICTIVRRWGFPHSPVHPIYTPSRLKVSVEYRFYTGLPWFQKTGTMTAVKNFRAEALRDDEWVFSGQSFTDSVWMNRDGKLLIGDVPAESQKDIHGVGFFHRQSKDSFISLFLEHSAEGLPELAHTGAPTMYYRWHGAVWSRYPLPVKDVPEGAVLKQKNAYISIPFTEAEGPQQIEQLRRCLMLPVRIAADSTPVISEPGVVNDAGVVKDGSMQPGQLARPGESGDSPISKQQIWEALRDCKDAQLYTADINLVELGLIQDVRVRGGVVTVVMSMPHRGRSRPGYFIDGSISVHPTLSVPIRERIEQVPGVQQVVVIHTWDPEWNSNRITSVGRTKLGLPEN